MLRWGNEDSRSIPVITIKDFGNRLRGNVKCML